MIPSISYRTSDARGGINYSLPHPDNPLLGKNNITLLVHGFNNTFEQGKASYENFMNLQNAINPVAANVIAVYWPGDGWTKPLYYMNAVSVAKEVGPLLADDIYNAAITLGSYIEINFIAHSLGCRLVLEAIKALLPWMNKIPLVRLSRITFMAGAVPTTYLDLNFAEPEQLHAALGAFEKVQSLYSLQDNVLHWAFPVGESLTQGEPYFPTALGRMRWNGNNSLTQNDIMGAGHSDYWGGDSKKLEQLQKAAIDIRSFMNLGSLPDRQVGVNRNITGRDLLNRDIDTGK